MSALGRPLRAFHSDPSPSGGLWTRAYANTRSHCDRLVIGLPDASRTWFHRNINSRIRFPTMHFRETRTGTPEAIPLSRDDLKREYTMVHDGALWQPVASLQGLSLRQRDGRTNKPVRYSRKRNRQHATELDKLSIDHGRIRSGHISVHLAGPTARKLLRCALLPRLEVLNVQKRLGFVLLVCGANLVPSRRRGTTTGSVRTGRTRTAPRAPCAFILMFLYPGRSLATSNEAGPRLGTQSYSPTLPQPHT